MCDRSNDPTTYDLPEVCAICAKPEDEHGKVDQHEYMTDEQFARMLVAA